MPIPVEDRWLHRRQMIERVRRNEIQPKAAEDEAERDGYGPLVPAPDLSDYDPMDFEHWSLLMAVTWVLSPNLNAVRNSWNAYRAVKYEWVPLTPPPPLITPPPPFISSILPAPSGNVDLINRPPVSRPALRLGHELRPLRPYWLHQVLAIADPWNDILSAAASSPLPGGSFSKSWTRLHRALAKGRVVALAQDIRNEPAANVRPIQKNNFAVIRLGQDAGGADCFRLGYSGPVYVNVSVDRETLMAEFKPEPMRPTGARSLEPPTPGNVATPAKKRRRAPSRERRAILAYIVAVHGSVWPDLSNEDIAGRVITWITSDAERNKLYPIGELDEATVRRLKTAIEAGEIELPKTAD